MDLTEYAHQGFDAPEESRRYMVGSDAYIAWRVGCWLRGQRLDRPKQVLSAPGYRVLVDASRVFEVWEDTEVQDVTG